MTQLHYRTPVYRGIYAVVFTGCYLFFVAYLLSGDDSGSDNNTGVYRLIIGAVIACGVGALAGPALHRRLMKSRTPGSGRARRKSGHTHRSKRP
jgi:hypothetical protein